MIDNGQSGEKSDESGSKTEHSTAQSSPNSVNSNGSGDDAVSRSREMAAVARASWLAALADALEQAEELIGNLAAAGGEGVGMADLSPRLASARAEVRYLRLGAAIPAREIEIGGIALIWPLSPEIRQSSRV